MGLPAAHGDPDPRSQALASACLLGITVQKNNSIFFSMGENKLSSTEMHIPSGRKETMPGHLQASAYSCYVCMLGTDEAHRRCQYKSCLEDSSGN